MGAAPLPFSCLPGHQHELIDRPQRFGGGMASFLASLEHVSLSAGLHFLHMSDPLATESLQLLVPVRTERQSPSGDLLGEALLG